MDEWLERLDYGAESHRKVVSSRLGFAMRRLRKTLSVNPAVNVYLFRIREGSKRRRMGSAFHRLCPRYNGTLTPTAPTAIRNGYGETFTFFTYFKLQNRTKQEA